MAAPNLIALTTVHIDVFIAHATTAMGDLVTAVTSGHAYNIESVLCCNRHASLAGHIYVVVKKGGTEYYFAYNQRVGTGQTINVLLGKPMYLAEGDSIRIQADANSIFTCFAPYSDVV